MLIAFFDHLGYAARADQLARTLGWAHFHTSAKTEQATICDLFAQVLQATRKIASSVPQMQGWLEKRGGGTRVLGSTAFRKRWFVLSSDGQMSTLTYRESDTEGSPVKVGSQFVLPWQLGWLASHQEVLAVLPLSRWMVTTHKLTPDRTACSLF